MVLNQFPRVNGEVIDADDMNQSFYQGTFSTNLDYGSVSVDTNSTVIISTNSNRTSLLIRNTGSNIVYIGTGTVSSSNGFELEEDQSILLNTRDEIQALSSSGTQDVRYIETTL